MRRRERASLADLSAVVAAWRLLFAAITIAAVAAHFQHRSGQDGFDAVNHFSHFTILSSLIAAAVLLCGALLVLRRSSSPGYELARGAAVFYIMVTGIVFAVLLADTDMRPRWANVQLHQVMPVVMVADWVLAPTRVRIEYRLAIAWLAFLALYLVYTLVRGAIVDWYPYPFLDPDENEIGGYGGVAVYSAGIAVGAVAGAYVVAAVGNRVRITR